MFPDDHTALRLINLSKMELTTRGRAAHPTHGSAFALNYWVEYGRTPRHDRIKESAGIKHQRIGRDFVNNIMRSLYNHKRFLWGIL